MIGLEEGNWLISIGFLGAGSGLLQKPYGCLLGEKTNIWSPVAIKSTITMIGAGCREEGRGMQVIGSTLLMYNVRSQCITSVSYQVRLQMHVVFDI